MGLKLVEAENISTLVFLFALEKYNGKFLELMISPWRVRKKFKLFTNPS